MDCATLCHPLLGPIERHACTRVDCAHEPTHACCVRGALLSAPYVADRAECVARPDGPPGQAFPSRFGALTYARRSDACQWVDAGHAVRDGAKGITPRRLPAASLWEIARFQPLGAYTAPAGAPPPAEWWAT